MLTALQLKGKLGNYPKLDITGAIFKELPGHLCVVRIISTCYVVHHISVSSYLLRALHLCQGVMTGLYCTSLKMTSASLWIESKANPFCRIEKIFSSVENENALANTFSGEELWNLNAWYLVMEKLEDILKYLSKKFSRVLTKYAQKLRSVHFSCSHRWWSSCHEVCGRPYFWASTWCARRHHQLRFWCDRPPKTLSSTDYLKPIIVRQQRYYRRKPYFFFPEQLSACTEILNSSTYVKRIHHAIHTVM